MILDRVLAAVGLERRGVEQRDRAWSDPVLAALWEGASPEARIALPAVESCVALIAGTIASLPIRVVRPREDGTLEAVPGHPASRVLSAPNPELTAFELVERIVADAALSGQGTALIERDGRGAPGALVYLPPGHATAERSPASGHVFWRVTDPRTNEHRVTSDEDVLAIRYRLNPSDPLRGLALPAIGRGALELATATERHARNLFERGARPGGFLKLERKLTPEGKARLRDQIETFFGGQHSGRVAVLEEGMAWQEVGASNRDSQLVEAMEVLTAGIARLFGVPRALIGSGEGQNYSSTAALVAAWTRTGLRSWLSRIEAAATDKLLSEDAKGAGLAVRFDVGELTRLDEKDRAEVYAKGIAAGWLAPNEARARENMPPLPGGDDLIRTPGATIADEGGRPEGSRTIESGDPTPGPNPEA